jgi:hypothetical protein
MLLLLWCLLHCKLHLECRLNLGPAWLDAKMWAYQNVGKPVNFGTYLVEGQKISPPKT